MVRFHPSCGWSALDSMDGGFRAFWTWRFDEAADFSIPPSMVASFSFERSFEGHWWVRGTPEEVREFCEILKVLEG